jgi:hypothetical protein
MNLTKTAESNVMARETSNALENDEDMIVVVYSLIEYLGINGESCGRFRAGKLDLLDIRTDASVSRTRVARVRECRNRGQQH